jgi:hypothetical protein
MTTSALELISFVARRLIQYETRFYREEASRRRQVSEYFAAMASAIAALNEDLNRQKVPHESARELAKLASQLPAHVEDALGNQETERLRQLLEQGCDIDRIYREFNDTGRAFFFSDELGKAVILLNALSQGLFLPPNAHSEGYPSGYTDPVL